VLCACGCGLPANPALGAFVDYPHAGRYERNGRRAVPLEVREIVSKRCRYCGETVKRAKLDYHPRCKPASEGLTGPEIRLLARTLVARDPYPLETTSADVTLAGPSIEDTDRLRQRERGLVQVECGGCGGEAWQEPVVFVNGVATTVVRCRACDTQRKCVGCGVRPPRYKRDLCTECVREKREETQTMAATAAKLCCKYCGEEIKLRPQDRNITRVTCGSKECSKKHINFLSTGKKSRAINGTTIAPAAVLEAALERAKPDLEKWDKKQAPPQAPVQPDAPVLCGSPDSSGLPVTPTAEDGTPVLVTIPEQPAQQHNPRCYQLAVEVPTSLLVMSAVIAMEALPDEKWAGIMEVLQARREARLVAERAEGLLQALGVA